MESTTPQGIPSSTRPDPEATELTGLEASLTRRGFLRGAALAADRPGLWAFHCHILPHVEGLDGMFGMVTALIVVPEKKHIDAIYKALGIA